MRACRCPFHIYHALLWGHWTRHRCEANGLSDALLTVVQSCSQQVRQRIKRIAVFTQLCIVSPAVPQTLAMLGTELVLSHPALQVVCSQPCMIGRQTAGPTRPSVCLPRSH